MGGLGHPRDQLPTRELEVVRGGRRGLSSAAGEIPLTSTAFPSHMTRLNRFLLGYSIHSRIQGV
jgi:hypothetical protein